MKSEKIVVQNIDDSISLYKKNVLVKNYQPKYDLNKSYEYFDHIIKLSLNKIKLYKNNGVSWSYESLILQPLFWYVSLNIIKYKDFFDEYGFEIPSKNLNEDVRNSYKRAILFYENDSLFKRLITNIRSIKSKIFIIVWIIINYLKRNEGKIWIDRFIINDYRFNHPNLKKIIKNSNHVEILNKFSAVTSFNYKKKSFFDGLKKEIFKRTADYKYWSFAINILKPKKIIVRDDLGISQGILLAAKLNDIEIIGINHGVLSQWQSYVFGPRSFCILNPITFNKIYVLHSSFLDLFHKKTTLYNPKQIKLSGWLQKFNYGNNQYNKNGCYVLYPFEHHTDFFSIKNLLLKFINLGKKIVVKKYPGWKNYEMFNNMNIEIVDDFSNKHLDNTFAVVALTTTMVFEFIARKFFVIYPANSGYNLFEGLKIPGLISDKDFFDGKKNIYFDFKLEEITDEFKKEFI